MLSLYNLNLGSSKISDAAKPIIAVFTFLSSTNGNFVVIGEKYVFKFIRERDQMLYFNN